MNRTLRLVLGGTALTACLAGSSFAPAAVMLTGSPYTQDFDSLDNANTGVAWTNDSTLPGWSLFRQPAPGTAVPTYNAGTGSSNTGAFYSFGASASTDRALGSVGSGGSYFGSPASGTVAGWFALALTNDTGLEIDSFTLLFDGEQWRNGGNASAQTMVLEYGFGPSFDTVASWTAPGAAWDFTTPVVGTTSAAVDGNLAGNRTAGLGGTIATNWADGDTLWFRWTEFNDVGNDHGMGVDNLDFSYTTVAIPEPSALALCGLGALSLAALRFRGK